MKKLISMMLVLMCMQQVYAADTANIRIKIAGPINDNTYFLCIPDVGCLSMLAAKQGKVYPMVKGEAMNTLFVTNAHNMHLYNQGLPSSCDITVKSNQTITIQGTLNTQSHNVKVEGLHCTVT